MASKPMPKFHTTCPPGSVLVTGLAEADADDEKDVEGNVEGDVEGDGMVWRQQVERWMERRPEMLEG